MYIVESNLQIYEIPYLIRNLFSFGINSKGLAQGATPTRKRCHAVCSRRIYIDCGYSLEDSATACRMTGNCCRDSTLYCPHSMSLFTSQALIGSVTLVPSFTAKTKVFVPKKNTYELLN